MPPTPTEPSWTIPDDRPEIYDVPVPRPVTVHRITLIGPYFLAVAGGGLIVGAMYFASRAVTGVDWVLPLILFGLGAMFVLVLELGWRRPLERSLRVVRNGTATPAEVVGLELTTLGRLSAQLGPYQANPAPGTASVIGLPRNLRVRLLAGPSKGKLVDIVVSAEPGIPWVSTGARVTVLMDPSGRGKHVLWEMARFWAKVKGVSDR